MDRKWPSKTHHGRVQFSDLKASLNHQEQIKSTKTSDWMEISSCSSVHVDHDGMNLAEINNSSDSSCDKSFQVCHEFVTKRNIQGSYSKDDTELSTGFNEM